MCKFSKILDQSRNSRRQKGDIEVTYWGWGPQILRPTMQNSDHHDDPAPGIYSALFFPPLNPRSSTDLGRNVDNVHCAFVFIYQDGNGPQPLSSHRTLQRARVKAK